MLAIDYVELISPNEGVAIAEATLVIVRQVIRIQKRGLPLHTKCIVPAASEFAVHVYGEVGFRNQYVTGIQQPHTLLIYR